jgi:voltage-gated potassium channel Kch
MVRYINTVYWAAATIMTVGYGDIVPTNDDELIIANVVMIVGICVFTYNLSSLA